MGKTFKIVLNVSVLLVVIAFVWYMVRSVNKEETTYVETQQEDPFSSSFHKSSSFDVSESITRFYISGESVYILAAKTVYICDTKGKQQAIISVASGARDITVYAAEIYILYPGHIEVYGENGQLVRQWEACSELSDYCSFTVAGDYVYVTDAENKNICQYTRDGNFVRFIKSPQGFIIPSYAFDIANYNDTLYCVNSGRHQIESYTSDGDFIAAFGSPGSEAGSFVGCCNPVFITITPGGELITSEKGIPRVSLFRLNGAFREILLNGRLLGGGNKAYQVRADGERLFVAGKNSITIFTQK